MEQDPFSGHLFVFCNRRKNILKILYYDPHDMDQQLNYIARTRGEFNKKGCPIISVDGKKKELIGNFKNHGAAYCRKPEYVNVYDFPSDAMSPKFLISQGGKRYRESWAGAYYYISIYFLLFLSIS